MQVGEAMTADVRTVRPDASLREAARLMAELDAGAVPVCADDRLVGMLTDRDIAVRAVAAGKGPDTPVREVMTEAVHFCFADEDCAAVSQDMGERQVRRLPVLDRDKRLVGILSLGNLSTRYSSGSAGGALGRISETEEMRSGA